MAVQTSIDAAAGRLFTFKVSNGADPPVFLTVGGLKDCKMSINGGAVDITNVASNGWREYLPGGGVKEMSLSGSGAFDSRTQGARKIWDAVMAQGVGGYIELQIISGHLDSFVGTYIVESYDRSGSDSGAEAFSVSLKSSGPPQYIPAP